MIPQRLLDAMFLLFNLPIMVRKVGCSFLLCFISAVTLSGAEVPEIAYRSLDGRPVWVAASTAFDENGHLRADLFSERVRNRFGRIASKNRTRCEVYAGSGPLEIFERMDSIQSLAEHSKTIVEGTVTDAIQGFYADNPGTLFAIAVAGALKGDRVREHQHVFLFIGYAKIDTPEGAICAMPPKGTTVPAVGDRVLFFSSLQPADTEQRIYLIEPHRQLIVQTSSQLAIPDPLRSAGSTARDFAEVITSVKTALTKREAREKR